LKKAKLLDADNLKRIYKRFALQFIEPFDDLSDVAIIGMQTRGVYIAQRVQGLIQSHTGTELPLGVLDITFYRDDFRTRSHTPTVQLTDIPFELSGKHIILVDDVLYTGRTVRAAMEALTSFGRPSSIVFTCLIDRGHRELPVIADYVGMYVPTHTSEEVQVQIEELDGEDAVYVVDRSDDVQQEKGDG
jgi:pyrimidine operon attenuation protein / uracil phosphoribosyltransferase